MTRRQKGKGSKRAKHWHRHDEADRFDQAMADWPDTGITADPTGAPIPLRRDGGPSRIHHDSAP